MKKYIFLGLIFVAVNGWCVTITPTGPKRTVRFTSDEPINVKDYGAVGNGIAVDSTAWTAAINAADSNGTIVTPFVLNNIGTITLDKKVRIVGIGREQCEIFGNWIILNGAVGSSFEDMIFKNPTSTLFNITGGGGLDFKRCTIDPGAGKTIFTWNDDGHTINSIELIGTYIRSGKLLNCSAGGVTTFSIHAKEGSLITFAEDDQILTSQTNYGSFLGYNSLINNAAFGMGTNNRVVMQIRDSDIDDATTGYFLTDGTSTYDTLEITNCSYSNYQGLKRTWIQNFSDGSGLTGNASPYVSALTGSHAFDAKYNLDTYFVYGDTVCGTDFNYSITGGLFNGQHIKVIFTGTYTPNAHTVNFFGLLVSSYTATVSPHVIELYYYTDTGWIATGYGKSVLSYQNVTTGPSNGDTSGLAIGDLENEVNELKSALRSAGIIGP